MIVTHSSFEKIPVSVETRRAFIDEQLYDGIQTERDNLCLRYQKLSAADFAANRARIAGGTFTAGQLVTLFSDLQRDRFDEYVPEALLQTAFINEVLDLSSA